LILVDENMQHSLKVIQNYPLNVSSLSHSLLTLPFI